MIVIGEVFVACCTINDTESNESKGEDAKLTFEWSCEMVMSFSDEHPMNMVLALTLNTILPKTERSLEQPENIYQSFIMYITGLNATTSKLEALRNLYLSSKVFPEPEAFVFMGNNALTVLFGVAGEYAALIHYVYVSNASS